MNSKEHEWMRMGQTLGYLQGIPETSVHGERPRVFYNNHQPTHRLLSPPPSQGHQGTELEACCDCAIIIEL